MTNKGADARVWQLLNLLADGRFHSGELLGEQLGISRASVFNALSHTSNYGVTLQRIRGRGYRLARPWQPLRRDDIMLSLGRDAELFDPEILPQATSSNSLLLQQAALGASSGKVLAVELQSAGRGRLGRTWHSGLGNALTFSLLWRFDRGLNTLSGLSLAVGMAMVRALTKLGARGVQLKWPNDILAAQGKLAGVLIEAQGDMLGPCAVVIGIGLNCTMPASIAQHIDQPASALDEVCVVMPSRNLVLATVLAELAAVLKQFAQDGFGPMREEWERNHANQDRKIRLQMPDGTTLDGWARGVSDIGELRLETAQGVRLLNSGEVGNRQ